MSDDDFEDTPVPDVPEPRPELPGATSGPVPALVVVEGPPVDSETNGDENNNAIVMPRTLAWSTGDGSSPQNLTPEELRSLIGELHTQLREAMWRLTEARGEVKKCKGMRAALARIADGTSLFNNEGKVIDAKTYARLALMGAPLR